MEYSSVYNVVLKVIQGHLSYRKDKYLFVYRFDSNRSFIVDI